MNLQIVCFILSLIYSSNSIISYEINNKTINNNNDIILNISPNITNNITLNKYVLISQIFII